MKVSIDDRSSLAQAFTAQAIACRQQKDTNKNIARDPRSYLAHSFRAAPTSGRASGLAEAPVAVVESRVQLVLTERPDQDRDQT